MVEMKKTLTDPETEKIRADLNQRGLWLYNFLQTAREKGIDFDDYGRATMFKCGCMQGMKQLPPTDSLVELAKNYVTPGGRKAYEIDVPVCTEEKVIINSTYCPMVELWRELTGNDEAEVEYLCDLWLDTDRGKLSNFPQFEFEIKQTIPKGDPLCSLEIVRKKETKND